MTANLRREGGREVGEALLDQRLVSGIGNLWRAEALWHAGVSPWRTVGTSRMRSCAACSPRRRG